MHTKKLIINPSLGGAQKQQLAESSHLIGVSRKLMPTLWLPFSEMSMESADIFEAAIIDKEKR